MSERHAGDLLERWRGARTQWEAEAAGRISSVRRDDLILASQDSDPNVRILACWLMGELGDPKAVPSLLVLLGDKSQNRCSGLLQCEEAEAVYVGAAAAEALVRLSYASSVEAVYERAKREHRVPSTMEVLHNIY